MGRMGCICLALLGLLGRGVCEGSGEGSEGSTSDLIDLFSGSGEGVWGSVEELALSQEQFEEEFEDYTYRGRIMNLIIDEFNGQEINDNIFNLETRKYLIKVRIQIVLPGHNILYPDLRH